MDLIHEQYIVGFKVSQNCSEVTGLFQHRSRGLAKIGTHLVGNNMGQCGLTQSGWTEYQYMIQRFTSITRCTNKYLELLTHPHLAHKLVHGNRS